MDPKCQILSRLPIRPQKQLISFGLPPNDDWTANCKYIIMNQITWHPSHQHCPPHLTSFSPSCMPVVIVLSKYWVCETINKSEKAENLSQVTPKPSLTVWLPMWTFFGESTISFPNLRSWEYNMWSRNSDIWSASCVSHVNSNGVKVK
jgi:hypothetical protein